jgi:hypothetical protein
MGALDDRGVSVHALAHRLYAVDEVDQDGPEDDRRQRRRRRQPEELGPPLARSVVKRRISVCDFICSLEKMKHIIVVVAVLTK